jgi:Phytanoyl-CoA dioxygenase (PhyH)
MIVTALMPHSVVVPSATPSHSFDAGAILGALYGEGIVGLRAAFSPAWADAMAGDVHAAFAAAQAVAGGLMPRGPNRWYVEVQPEAIGGFVDILAHPWFQAVCSTVLGEDYRVVELGFDLPLPGALDQPWHRDFPGSPPGEAARLTSLAFNLTGIDTRPEHGPFEIAPGTQWDPLTDAAEGMFPPREGWPRFAERAVPKMAQRGDLSARTGLTVHRGTANRSDEARPVLIVGVVAAQIADPASHQLRGTQAWLDSCLAELREHLLYDVVPEFAPIVQAHRIEGLMAAG